MSESTAQGSGGQGVAGTDWPQGRFTGPDALRQLVRDAVQLALTHGIREMFWSDPDYADWPLGEAGLNTDLNRWARSGGQLRMLATDFRAVEALHARFVTWRAQWSHQVEARAVRRGTSRAALPVTPSAIWLPQWSFERIDTENQIMLATTDRVARMHTLERMEGHWRQAGPGFAPTTLGL
jgi:hypothetical protein